MRNPYSAASLLFSVLAPPSISLQHSSTAHCLAARNAGPGSPGRLQLMNANAAALRLTLPPSSFLQPPASSCNHQSVILAPRPLSVVPPYT